MKKISTYASLVYRIIAISVMSFAASPYVYGTTAKTTVIPCPDPSNPVQLCNPIRYPDITSFLLAILNTAIQYGALLIVFFLVYAGFQFVIAQGNSEKIESAKKMLTWIVIGAFVLLGVYVIRAAICGTLTQLGVSVTCEERYTPPG